MVENNDAQIVDTKTEVLDALSFHRMITTAGQLAIFRDDVAPKASETEGVCTWSWTDAVNGAELSYERVRVKGAAYTDTIERRGGVDGAYVDSSISADTNGEVTMSFHAQYPWETPRFYMLCLNFEPSGVEVDVVNSSVAGSAIAAHVKRTLKAVGPERLRRYINAYSYADKTVYPWLLFELFYPNTPSLPYILVDELVELFNAQEATGDHVIVVRTPHSILVSRTEGVGTASEMTSSIEVDAFGNLTIKGKVSEPEISLDSHALDAKIHHKGNVTEGLCNMVIEVTKGLLNPDFVPNFS